MSSNLKMGHYETKKYGVQRNYENFSYSFVCEILVLSLKKINFEKSIY